MISISLGEKQYKSRIHLLGVEMMKNCISYDDFLKLCSNRVEISYELKCAIESIIKAWDNFVFVINSPKIVKEKGWVNFVTDYDLIIEREIINYLNDSNENILVISEESFPFRPSGSSIYWILDPIDGTTNLLHGFESVSTALALVKQQQICCSVVFCPFKQEIYFAETGKGAYKYKNGKVIRLKVSRNSILQDSVIGIGFPYERGKIDFILNKVRDVLKSCQDIKRNGPASLDICNVAEGKLDAYFELDLQLWDFMSSALILQEAGGSITSWDSDILPDDKGNILASNGYLHDVIKDILNK